MTDALATADVGNPLHSARQLVLQRDITVETQQALPRPVIELDASDTTKLDVRYGDDLVAKISVKGPNANVDALLISDRTGSRNQGGVITAIDLQVVHPPGWVVTITPIGAALAHSKKVRGVGELQSTDEERKPPYGKDELQLWPPAGAMQPIRQRREMNTKEKERANTDRRKAQERDVEVAQKRAELLKEWDRINGSRDYWDSWLMDVYGLGLIFQMMASLPPADLYNNVSEELKAAMHAIQMNQVGGARLHLKRADALMRSNKAQIDRAMKRGLENLDTAIRVTRKASAITTFIGETIARLIPGPIGRVLTFLFEVLKPPPKNMEEAADRMQGWVMTVNNWMHEDLLKNLGSKPSGGEEAGPGGTPTGTTVKKPSGGKQANEEPETPSGETAKKPAGTVKEPSKVGGDPDEFVLNQAARVADQPTPALEDFSGFVKVKQIGGQGGPAGAGINVKYLLRDPSGKQWMFKPANAEESMYYGPELGIKAGERYRRAAAAAYVSDQLGVDTPGVRLGTWNNQKGSLQEWRPGYETGTELKAADRQAFDQFYNSQSRKDLDALDYVTAQQDRHMGNVMLKPKQGGGYEVMAIDQDAAFPTSKARFDPKENPDPRYAKANYQRPLSKTMGRDMAERMRKLDSNWPEAELRRWLTQDEVDGARARLTEVVTKLHNGDILVVDK